jgi:hypothetical protein
MVAVLPTRDSFSFYSASAVYQCCSLSTLLSPFREERWGQLAEGSMSGAGCEGCSACLVLRSRRGYVIADGMVGIPSENPGDDIFGLPSTSAHALCQLGHPLGAYPAPCGTSGSAFSGLLPQPSALGPHSRKCTLGTGEQGTFTTPARTIHVLGDPGTRVASRKCVPSRMRAIETGGNNDVTF